MTSGDLLILTISLFMVSCTGNVKDKKKIEWLETPAAGDVKISDRFWSPMITRNRVVTIPYVFSQCEATGRIDNFAIAGGVKEGKHTGERYNDSDVFKAIEGACYSIMETPDPHMRHYIDSLVTIIAAAQEDDGYIYTTRTIDPFNMAPGAGRERWIDERVSHELYNVGHMYEAAVAHYLATGSDTFLNVALKNAALVEKEFGWGKREIAPGHQEIEIGLIKLYKVTGDSQWLDLARFFIDVRGRGGDYVRHPDGSRFTVYNDSVYLQMHKPVLEQKEAVGHAVRGAYMFTAMADLSEATGDNSYLDASEVLWQDVTRGKIYITGGIGSKEYGEAFGDSFELPNMTAYTETCASVANVFWNHRLYRATGDAKYIDVLERTLYNGLISGIGFDGCHFFYPNPLESDGSFERAGWFDCSCCPVNVARFMPVMDQYIYSSSGNTISVNLFIGSEASFRIKSGEVKITQDTDFPWSGKVSLRISPGGKDMTFLLRIRVPAWTGLEPFAGGLYRYITPAMNKMEISVNGRAIQTGEKSGFIEIERKWNMGDTVTIALPMEPRFIVARDEVAADSGRVALGIGPLVFCLEEEDNGKVRDIKVDPQSKATYHFDDDFMGGSGTVTFNAFMPDGTERQVRAIPYYSWANRGKGEMIVWMRRK